MKWTLHDSCCELCHVYGQVLIGWYCHEACAQVTVKFVGGNKVIRIKISTEISETELSVLLFSPSKYPSFHPPIHLQIRSDL